MTRTVNEIDLFDPESLDDPYPLYQRLRDTAPVHRVDGTDFYLVSRWDLVVEATTRLADFSSHLTAALVRQPDGSAAVFDMDGEGQAVHVLATADDPEHLRHRKLVLPTLVAKRVRALEPAMAANARRLWVEGVRGGRVEWMAAMADRLPMTMVANLIGLPAADIPQLVEWGYGSTELLGGVLTTDRLGVVITAATELAAYLHRAFTAACVAPGDDLLGDLARACASGDLEPHVAALLLVQLVGAGGESTAGLIGNAVRLLATDPGLQQRLRAEPDLLPGFLEEVLRLESPFRAHHRHVVADTTLGGVDLPAGAHLLLLWGAANRDPAIFPEADLLRLDRAVQRGHLAFGKGVHFCVGAALARLEARVALETLLGTTESFELAPEPDAAQWVPSIFVRRHARLELVLH
ncbi:cytochrome P450 [Nocardia bhagyanarayanae]|uniref:Cytochrome P450 n=1 Tax=Nocardia bhagyanarayanae TaxID=1215925 RepID=A0A543EUW5_9NOCA|nr:cytochrome P450 [Nocardia bhagyanarayanae]TQM25365.1 cytochrome P450 [Nocardia bhagyanarayanae]